MKHFALLVRTMAAWLVTLLLIFPLIWLVLTAFKTELQAISVPPHCSAPSSAPSCSR